MRATSRHSPWRHHRQTVHTRSAPASTAAAPAPHLHLTSVLHLRPRGPAPPGDFLPDSAQHQPSLINEHSTRCHKVICLIQPEQWLSCKTKRDSALHSNPAESPVRKLAAVPTILCP